MRLTLLALALLLALTASTTAQFNNCPPGFCTIYGSSSPPPPSGWILATGFWDDSGMWVDSAVWID